VLAATAPLYHAGLISGALAATAPLDRACSTSFTALSRALSASPPPCAVLPASAVPLALTASATSRSTNASSSVWLAPLRIFPVKERQTFLILYVPQLTSDYTVSVTVRTFARGRLGPDKSRHSLQPSASIGVSDEIAPKSGSSFQLPLAPLDILPYGRLFWRPGVEGFDCAGHSSARTALASAPCGACAPADTSGRALAPPMVALARPPQRLRDMPASRRGRCCTAARPGEARCCGRAS